MHNAWLQLLELLKKVRGPKEALHDWAEQWTAAVGQAVQNEAPPSRSVVRKWVEASHEVAAAFYLTQAGHSDALIAPLIEQARWGEVLALHTPINRIHLDLQPLINWDPELTGLWFNSGFYLKTTISMVDPWAESQLVTRTHAAGELPLEVSLFNEASHTSYFVATYFDGGFHDRPVRERINADVRRSPFVQSVQIDNQPIEGEIAVISSGWSLGHPIREAIRGCIEALAKTHRLTLFLTRPHSGKVDTSCFAAVHLLDTKQGLRLSSLINNQFSAALFTDIGLNVNSIILANLRIAPMQIACYGHPASTFGALIDAFLCGDAIEPKDSEIAYSERTVALDGLSLTPTSEPRARGHRKKDEKIRVACAWSTTKISPDSLRWLESLSNRCHRAVEFRVFTTNISALTLHQAAANHGLQKLLSQPGSIILYPLLPKETFLSTLYECDLGIDIFPFGGFSTVRDFVEAAQPIAAMDSFRAAGRLAGAYLRRLGLDELVATSLPTYENLILRLIHDDGYRHGIETKLQGLDLNTPFAKEGQQMAEAVRTLERQGLQSGLSANQDIIASRASLHST